MKLSFVSVLLAGFETWMTSVAGRVLTDKDSLSLSPAILPSSAIAPCELLKVRRGGELRGLGQLGGGEQDRSTTAESSHLDPSSPPRQSSTFIPQVVSGQWSR